MHLHANDRRGLEQLCRYGARGAIALSRLSELPDGSYAYRMKRPLPDGRTQLVLDGVGLLKKLAPIIPPPRFHLLRFHGKRASLCILCSEPGQPERVFVFENTGVSPTTSTDVSDTDLDGLALQLRS